IFSVPISITLGVIAGLKENTWVDSLVSVVSLSVVGLPEFVTGLLLINILALGLGLFPSTATVSGKETFGEWLHQLILPAVTATFVLLGYIVRMTRAGVID